MDRYAEELFEDGDIRTIFLPIVKPDLGYDVDSEDISMTKVHNGPYYAEPTGEYARLKEFQRVAAELGARYVRNYVAAAQVFS